jgi:transcriptional/translational regulatory protein YebC/TACO1
LSKEITNAVIENGDNPDYNYKLRSLLEKAKKEGMKKDTIEKAIKNGRK